MLSSLLGVKSAIALLLVCGCASAQAIHVQTTGNDATGDGSSGNPYKTVTKAATVAPAGATIQLGAGTFGDDEQIEFTTKSLTLVGSGVGVTVVKPHPTLVKSLPAGDPPGVPTDHRVAILVNGPARIDVRDLTIDCDFRVPSSGRLHGIYFRDGADGTVDGCEIKNVRANPLNGIQGPVAVVVRADNLADPCLVTVRRCHVHNWGKNGFAVNYNASVVIEENVVAASGQVGLGLPAQNGIQVSRGAVGIVRKNVVTDSFYVPGPDTATGILLFNSGPGTVVEANDVTRCETAVYSFQSPAGSASTMVRRNRLSEGTWGIQVFDHAGVTVSDNVIHGFTAIDAVADDTPGNSWSRNNYSSWSGIGPMPIAGGAGITDTTPRRSCDDLGSATTVGVGGVPVEILALELNGSGLPDFVTVNEPATPLSQPSISVGLSTGSLSFSVTTTSFGAAGAVPAAIVAGEFNGSAGADLAVVTANENRFYVFANDGTGSFSLLFNDVLPAAALVPNDIAAGDVNADTRDDLVVATLGGFSSAGGGFVLQNGGNGTSWTASALPGAFSFQCKGVAVGRIEAGSSQGVALTQGSGTTGQVHLYRNVGAGPFTEIAGSPFAADADPTSVAISDLDNDGRNDVVVTCTRATLPLVPGSAVVLRNRPAGFSSQSHATGRGPQGIVPGDLADDADPDTVRRDALLVNFVDGTLSELSTFGVEGFAGNFTCLAGVTPRSVAVSHMAGSSFADVVVADAASSNVRILRGAVLARDDVFGNGCPGTSGRVPVISASGAPAIPIEPNATFGVQVNNARPLSVGILIASTSGFSAPPCTFLLGSVDLVWTAFTNGGGHANVAIPIPPPAPSLVGVVVYFQWGVIDPLGGFASTVSLSEGLKVRVGN